MGLTLNTPEKALTTSVAGFTDDKVIFNSHEDSITASQYLQNHLNNIES